MQIQSDNQPSRAALKAVVAALALLSPPLLASDYSSAVLQDAPAAFYRFNDSTVHAASNLNSGSLGAAGNFTNTANVRSVAGAIVGTSGKAQFYDTGTCYGMIPFNAALNPDNTQPFTVEAWFYPASDQINGGQCAMNNRVSSGVTDRTGWVFFQRAPDSSYDGQGGYEGVGWNFRMYRGSGSSSGLDIVSKVPYEVGKWTHVVVVYDPVDVVNNAILTMYINGVAAETNVWANGTDPGYMANASGSDAGLSLGAYNNTSGAGGNPYFGGVDEFAFYGAKLTPAQILAHYQNATNASRTTAYESLVQADNPRVYLRFEEAAPTAARTALNWGDTRNTGVATHTAGVRTPAGTALAGEPQDGSAAYHTRNGNATTTMPWLADNNPSAGEPFTFEAWLKPMRDQQGGQCPVNNRWPKLGHRTGWVIFQRFPNASYVDVPGISNEGHGWCFRMYDGASGSGYDVLTGTDYVVGQWQHLVVTWEPKTDNGDPGFGNNQWQGVLTAYVDGVAVATNDTALYAANINPPEDGGDPADLAIGSYNAASTLGNNAYEGGVDELAIYRNYLLKPEQILAHYQAGTNSHPATNYATLVLTAAYQPGSAQRLGPKTYLRFNEAADAPAANQGSLGYLGDGNLVLTTNSIAGPQPPTFAGFEASNAAVPLDGTSSWASLNRPLGLNVSGQVTLEAWVKPGATQGELARIISHGPPTTSDYLVAPPLNSLTNSTEVFLGIEGAGARYVVGSVSILYTNATEYSSNAYTAAFSVPAGDLGGTSWVHLVGTYNGTSWTLYRNGVQVAATTAPTGALPVDGGDWAVGATGNGWADAFAGAIDEAAIYTTALTPAQVLAHYNAAVSGLPKSIAVSLSGQEVTLTWSAGTLQECATVNGTYVDNLTATSPFKVTATSGTQRFYRLKL